jgi:hypothetical protein
MVMLAFVLDLCSTYERQHATFVFLNLAYSLDMMFSSSSHLSANDKNSFFIVE